jgi:hypothetical protein
MRTTLRSQRGEQVIEGSALVTPPPGPRAEIVKGY